MKQHDAEPAIPGPVIAWIGGQFFQPHMETLGFRTRLIPLTKPSALAWEDIMAACGEAPDVVVYADRSLPPPLLGVERYPCLTAFYCIDAHIHAWYPLYAAAFDLCAVSLRDELPRFETEMGTERVLWLPPFAEDRYQPRVAAKDFDLLFVGTVDPETTPIRHVFLQRLADILPGLTVRRGDFGELMPRARVVLNIAERGDLNFRVFEALACGSCLLTPRIANGQSLLFSEGEQFAAYAPDDAADCARTANELLADSTRREALARAGHALVDAADRPRHRAEAFAALLRQGLEDKLCALRLAQGPGDARNASLRRRLRLLFLHWAEACGDPLLAGRYLTQARASA
ncbi:MAG: hypothetical protein AUJ49_03870 [Desulfovibrionaceae bacterium CG1_02_65_16]|nr:MAG: hypothetical protein AUJ49_03870 [Desulfovibrionaceae bacterium CG1_02_65_16]